MKPTDQNRLGELIGKMEVATTDGNVSTLTTDDIGDIYSWLVFAMSQDYGDDNTQLCECGQPKNSIRHSSATASSVDAHEFKPRLTGGGI
jgi:hypothetical protein